jgi:hypothetical protein
MAFWYSTGSRIQNKQECEENTREPKGEKDNLKETLKNQGLRRLGVPGLELNADPILYGVDVPLLMLGSLENPE